MSFTPAVRPVNGPGALAVARSAKARALSRSIDVHAWTVSSPRATTARAASMAARGSGMAGDAIAAGHGPLCDGGVAEVDDSAVGQDQAVTLPGARADDADDLRRRLAAARRPEEASAAK